MNISLRVITLLIFAFYLFVSCQPNPYKQGERIYNQYCVNCHMPDGKGFRMLYPPLKDSDYLSKNFDNLACIIRYGLKDTIQVNGIQYNLEMLGIKELNGIEITNLVNYINYRWNYREKEIMLEEIEAQLDHCSTVKNQPGTLN